MNLISSLKKLSKNQFPFKKNIFIVFGLVLFWIIIYPFTPINVTQSNATFEISSGSNLNQISNQLVEAELLNDSFRFKLLTFITGNHKNLKRGYYKIPQDTTPLKLLDILANGKSILFPITLVEGTTFKQTIQLIHNNKNIKKTLDGRDSQDILRLMGAKEKYIEGLFFPDTYHFHKNTTDLEILKNAYQVLQAKLEFLWENRTDNLPYKTAYEALVIASIIEKEIGVRDEAPEIAGVFVNRLSIGMPLQSDPTVIYGMGSKFKGNIRRKDLKKDTIFNTYTRKGIPPSPIAMVSLDSLEAALNPATTENFYFVAKGNRRHHFSKTLKEHNRAVYKYQKKKRK